MKQRKREHFKCEFRCPAPEEGVGHLGVDWREVLLAWGSDSDCRRVLLKNQRPAGDGG